MFKLLRNSNFNGESGSEPYTPTFQSFGASGLADGFYSPDLRGEFGAGLLDLHAVDDTELLSEVQYFKIFENYMCPLVFLCLYRNIALVRFISYSFHKTYM